MTQAASTFFRSTAGHRFAHDSTCSFSGSGNGDRTSGWTWWHRLWALPQRRRRETLRKSFSIKSRFRVSEVRRILLDGLSRACVKLQCTRLVSYHSMIRNLALSFELFLDCIEAARFLPKTMIRIYNWILSTKNCANLLDICWDIRSQRLAVQIGQVVVVCVQLQCTTLLSNGCLSDS